MKDRSVVLWVAVFCASVFLSPQALGQSPGVESVRRIVLDPGHGGRDPGAPEGETTASRQEKTLVLDIARRVGELLGKHLPEVEVIHTRTSDVQVNLSERTAIANRAGADLFISIHADAAPTAGPSGSSTWVMGLNRERENLEAARRENSVIVYEEDYQSRYTNFDPNDPGSLIIYTLQQADLLNRSVELAALFQKHYREHTTITTTRGVKQAGYQVLYQTAMPAVLTEVGFLTNASDRAFIHSEAGRAKIARSIFNAISEYKCTVERDSHILTLDIAGNERRAPNPGAAQTAALPRPTAASQPVASTDTRPATATPPAVTPEPVASVEPRSTVPAAAAAPSGTLFRIQVSAVRNPVERSRFGAYARQVVERRIGEYYKYFVGETPSYTEAQALQARVRSTFPDAFIVAFQREEPVPLTDEMKRP